MDTRRENFLIDIPDTHVWGYETYISGDSFSKTD